MIEYLTLSPGIEPGPRPAPELLQRALLGAGYDPGPVDGGLQADTVLAIKSFQADNGLEANGIVGPETWSALLDEEMQGIPGLVEGDEGGAVAMLQRMLRRSGFDPGPINGKFGRSVTAQVRNFQTAMQIVVDGQVGDQTWEMLG